MADTLRQDNFAQDNWNQDSFNSGSGTAFTAPKGWWKQHWWRGNMFAAGWYTGVGVDATANVWVPDAQGRIFYDSRPDRIFVNTARSTTWTAK